MLTSDGQVTAQRKPHRLLLAFPKMPPTVFSFNGVVLFLLSPFRNVPIPSPTPYFSFVKFPVSKGFFWKILILTPAMPPTPAKNRYWTVRLRSCGRHRDEMDEIQLTAGAHRVQLCQGGPKSGRPFCNACFTSRGGARKALGELSPTVWSLFLGLREGLCYECE
ncbi:hypothetical protein BHE74_00039358 [Ensete ventricosum]|nr:hypothetical protein BHE74_00039358 [Ensete ventricosum]